MRHKILFVLATLFFINALEVQARDKALHFSIQDALASVAYEGRLDDNIKLYFDEQPHDQISREFGDFVTNKKTNGFAKADKKACEWALLSALLTLQDRAIKEGGNAVVNIHSYYQQIAFNSPTEFECHSGAIMVGVALKGTVVQID